LTVSHAVTAGRRQIKALIFSIIAHTAYGYDTWSYILREENIFTVFENSVLREIPSKFACSTNENKAKTSYKHGY
jgi:hypothetical protein